MKKIYLAITAGTLASLLLASDSNGIINGIRADLYSNMNPTENDSSLQIKPTDIGPTFPEPSFPNKLDCSLEDGCSYNPHIKPIRR